MAANLERLKKRIKTLEEWVDENEAIGGPEGTLDTVNYLISRQKQAEQMQNHLNQLQQYLQEYLNETESMDQWNEFIRTKEGEKNAVQKRNRKCLDAIVVNDVAKRSIGFDSDENEVTLLHEHGETTFHQSAKAEIASKLVAAISALYANKRA